MLKGFLHEIRHRYMLFLMILPVIVYFIIFAYIPMPGLYIAFVNYHLDKGIFDSQFIGFDNFKFLISTGALWQITRNTLLYNMVFLILGNIVQVALSIFIFEIGNKIFKKITQSIILLPFFISTVIVGLFSYNFFNFEYGFANTILTALGFQRHDFYSDPGIWKYIITAFKIWSGTGYGMIVYLAVITGFSSELFEAAYLDGANEWQKIRYLTVPMLKPTFILLLLFGLGGILKGAFDLFYNIIGNNSLLFPQTDIIDTYVFRSIAGSFNLPLGSAAGFYQSLFGFVIVLLANYVVRKIEPENALF